MCAFLCGNLIMRYTIAIVLGSLYVLFETEGIMRPRESLEGTITVESERNRIELVEYALDRVKVIIANEGKESERQEEDESDETKSSLVNGEAEIRELNPLSEMKSENNRDASELDEIHQKILSEEKATMEAVTAELRQLEEQLKHYRDELEKRKCSKRRSRNKAN